MHLSGELFSTTAQVVSAVAYTACLVAAVRRAPWYKLFDGHNSHVLFGALVGGMVSFGVWMWNVTHPDVQIPAEQAVGLTTVLTGVGQVILVNRYGVTTE